MSEGLPINNEFNENFVDTNPNQRTRVKILNLKFIRIHTVRSKSNSKLQMMNKRSRSTTILFNTTILYNLISGKCCRL